MKIHGKDLKRFVNGNSHHDASADREVRKRVVLEIFHLLDNNPDPARRIFQEDFPQEGVQEIVEKLAGWKDPAWQKGLLKIALRNLVFEIIEHSREDPETRARYAR